ncbi:MAG: AgmX/PglI C-terminal domain-containing protein [Polyangiaceae bacterium]
MKAAVLRRAPPVLLAAAWLTGSALIGCNGCDPQDAGSGGPSVPSECDPHSRDERGCLTVGMWRREEAEHPLQGSRPKDRLHAASEAAVAFSRACDAGLADGCLEGADLLEAPYLPAARNDLFGDAAPARGEDAGAPPPLARISSAELTARDRLLDAGCTLGANVACHRLGSARLGLDPAGATSAFERACALDGHAWRPLALDGDCRAVRAEVVARSEAHRAACTAKDPDACGRLALMLAHLDLVRAPPVLAEEVAIRGEELHPGGAEGFVVERLRRYRADKLELRAAGTPGDRGRLDEGTVAERTAIPAPPAPRSAARGKPVVVRIGLPSVHGPLRIDDVRRIAGEQRAAFEDCYRPALAADPELMGRVGIRVVVDRSGHVYQASNGGSDLPNGEVIACMVGVIGRTRFPAPDGAVATLIVPVMVLPR